MEQHPTYELPVRGVISLVILGLFCGFGWLVWHSYGERPQLGADGQPRLVRNDVKTFKSKPNDPGGRDFNNERSPYRDRLRARVNEPVTGPFRRSEIGLPPEGFEQDQTNPLAGIVPELKPETDPAAVVDPVATPAPLPQRKPVPTELASLEPIQSTALPSPASADPVTTTPVAGVYRVQLLASTDERAARAALETLRSRYDDLIGTLPPSVERGSDNRFRVKIGAFIQSGGATSVCDSLKARGQDCFVTND